MTAPPEPEFHFQTPGSLKSLTCRGLKSLFKKEHT
jgi:hypothetical protein